MQFYFVQSVIRFCTYFVGSTQKGKFLSEYLKIKEKYGGGRFVADAWGNPSSRAVENFYLFFSLSLFYLLYSSTTVLLNIGEEGKNERVKESSSERRVCLADSQFSTQFFPLFLLQKRAKKG